jgi:hypothetical protein
MRISQVDGKDLLFTIFEEPLGLNKGKKAWNCFSAACEFIGTLRQQGQTGITINVYLADGALFTSLNRKFQARHFLYYRSGLASEDELRAFRLEISDWTICLKCSSHSCSNALKWGLKRLAGKEIIDATHISTASLVNAATALHLHVEAFVFRHVSFVGERSGTFQEIEAFWRMLGVGSEMLDELSRHDLDWTGFGPNRTLNVPPNDSA